MLTPPTNIDAARQSHSLTVSKHIKNLIKSSGPISFARYMQEALYAPNLGYYCAGLEIFGENADFITAPMLSPLFGYCLGKQCAQILAALTNPGDILEFGPGQGHLAVSVLTFLAEHASLPSAYYILEVSAPLKQRQQKFIKANLPNHLSRRVIWLTELPKQFSGVILANEVLDAMPVHIFTQREHNTISECFVSYSSNKGFTWCQDAVSDQQITNYINSWKLSLPPGYTSEINLNQLGWLSSIAKMLTQGVVLLIDYGFPRHEYYHPERRVGTLMCHFQQQTHSNPLIYPGIQDITSHIDFTSIAEHAYTSGMEISGYIDQAQFLFNCGLLDLRNLANKSMPLKYSLSEKQAISILTNPSEMGELCKVIALNKSLPISLLGFSQGDKTHTL